METRKLSVKLTDEEVAARSTELAQAVSHFDEIESKRVAEQAARKGELKHVEGEIRRLARAVRYRVELREVEVRDVRNNFALTIDTVREDTGEIIASRPMTTDELQHKLFEIRGGKAGKGKAGSASGSDTGSSTPEP